MKICFFLLIFIFASVLGFCHSTKPEKQDDKVIITKKENSKYGLTATFWGIVFKPDENGKEYKIITGIVFRDVKSGAEVTYRPAGVNNDSGEKGLDSVITPDFYFTDIWSPDEGYLVLPIGMIEGFAVFEAKDALKNIKDNNYFDTIKVKSENSGWFWHNFEKWEDDSTFSFRAGLSGDMFAFKYNIDSAELYCYQEKCEENNIGLNNKIEIKAIKKGDIEPTKIH